MYYAAINNLVVTMLKPLLMINEYSKTQKENGTIVRLVAPEILFNVALMDVSKLFGIILFIHTVLYVVQFVFFK